MEKWILVVDDDVMNLRMAEFILNKNGYSVIKTESAKSALELLKEIWYTKGAEPKYLAYEYEYTSDGQIHEFIDHVSGKSRVYKYDVNNRLLQVVEYENDDLYHDYSVELGYNTKGELSFPLFSP